jgi:hypothetical protein
MAVPYTFGNATTSIPLSNLDTNFATAITLGNTAVYLGNTTTSLGNVTLTNLTISNVASTFPNSFLANSSVTINGSSVSLGGSVTITAANPSNLTIGTGLSGTSYNGSANVTIAIDGTVATLTGSQTLTNKTISGANNTLSNIGNGSLSNSSVTIGNTSVSLGGTATTLGNVTLTNVTISTVASTFPNSFLANSTATLGNATITLGGTTTSVGNLTLTNATISSVSTPITVAQGGTGLVTITSNSVMLGNGTGNVQIVAPGTSGNVLTSTGTTWSSTAPTAQVYPSAGIANSTGTAWGTSYSTTGSGTVVALATSPTFVTPILGTPTSGTLTNTTGFPAANLAGTALPSAIVTSSLTALGTIATGVWNGTAIGIAYGGTGQTTASAGFNALSPITTTGDLILGNGTNSATRLGIGTSTYVLTSNGTTASWQAPASGGGTVNSGTANQVAYYASTGTAVSGASALTFDGTNLGIGTSSPGTRLTVYAGADGDVGFFRGGSARQVQIGTSSTAGYINTDNGSAGFEIRTNGVARAYFDNSGNLGLGVTPTGKAKFEVYTGSGAFAGISTRFNATNLPISFGITNSNGVPYLGVNTRQVSGTDGQTYDIDGIASRMWCNGGGFAFFTAPSGTAGNAISFTQAMTLNASGNLGIGTSSPQANLHVSFGSNLYIQDGGVVGWSGNPMVRNPAGSGYLVMVNGTGGGVGLSNNATSWTAISDERLKTDLVPIENGLSKVVQLRAVTGRYIADNNDVSRAFLIAQDVLAVLPEAVDTSNSEKYGLAYTDVIPLLVASIKELNTLITAQSATITSLTERITALENK